MCVTDIQRKERGRSRGKYIRNGIGIENLSVRQQTEQTDQAGLASLDWKSLLRYPEGVPSDREYQWAP
jgi:hypothetical protein